MQAVGQGQPGIIGMLGAQRLQQLGQRLGRGLQVLGHGHRQVLVNEFHIGDPQAVRQAAALAHAKALCALAQQVHQSGLRVLQLGNRRQRAHGMELFGWRARLAHLLAFAQRDHAKRCAGARTFAHHVQVAHLEHAQRQPAAGKQHAAQREQRQGSEGQG
ncbi:hypothetical protein D3C85_1476890 [compost metagenome]